MRDISDLLDKHHECMQEMYTDMMEMMGQYMKASLSGYMSIVKEYAWDEDDESASKNEAKDEDDEIESWLKLSEGDDEADEEGPAVIPPDVYASSEGVEYDDMGDPIVDSYIESDINPDAYSYGRSLGLPKTLVLNFNPRGEIDTQIEDG